MKKMKISSPKLFIVLQMIVLTVLSCEKETSNPPGDPQDTPVDIYVAGWENGTAKYWKNGEKVELDGNPQYEITSIAVNGSDVYVTGSDYFWKWGSWIGPARYWKNGEEVLLTNETMTVATSIYVADNDIYVAGYGGQQGRFVAKYWKNEQEIRLTDGTPTTVTKGIVVSDGDVYICGFEEGPIKPKYWKNGEPVSLSPLDYGVANSIAVVGNDVYVAGQKQNTDGKSVATYWKNGEAVALTDGTAPSADATSITVDGNDVYVAGWEGPFYQGQYTTGTGAIASYWKNGERVDLTNGSTFEYATSIAVFEGDVYVAGFEYNNNRTVAKYWKNGSSVKLIPSPTTQNGWTLASSIIVVPK